MLASAEETFAHLERLGDRAINTGLLAALAARGGAAAHGLARANLLRRTGDMAGARRTLFDWLASGTAPGGIQLADWSAIPPGLFSNGGFAIAPIVLIDDFLPHERMRALHAHACAREAQFRDALATNEDTDPAYDPDRRRTLLDYAFTQEREFFLGFIEQSLPAMRESLGLPDFEVERIELKLSNHVDGGFFKAHSDNHAAYGEAGRAITWLYYFGEESPRYRGGDLYVLDSKPAEQEISPAWFSRIEAVPNRLVAFPSWFYHAVAPTHLPGNRFEQGRFAVSSHIRKRADGLTVWWDTNSIDSTCEG